MAAIRRHRSRVYGVLLDLWSESDACRHRRFAFYRLVVVSSWQFESNVRPLMAQTYARRVELRPSYARYKNAKKELRKRLRMGRITPAQRVELQARAYREYLTGEVAIPTEDGPLVLAVEEVKAMGCNSRCWYAGHPKCDCQCDGRLHGVATS